MFPQPQEEQQAPAESAPWRVEFRQEAKTEQPVDPERYEWMNKYDRWMIGRPADKACWEYVGRMIDRRDGNALVMSALIGASWLPFPLNVIYLIWLDFMGRHRRKRRR